MNHRIALLIIYNHKFDKNIPILEELYKNKFSDVYHIIPFYDGSKENVLPVYEAPGRFQSYIAQAYQQIIRKKGDSYYTHYFSVSDDMILNPEINEKNFFNFLGIDTESCYITDLREIQKRKCCASLIPILLRYRTNKNSAELNNILPDANTAFDKFKQLGLSVSNIKINQLLKEAFNKLLEGNIIATLKYLFYIKDRKIRFPLIWAYSDVLLITEAVMPSFCTYCGAFAATDLFVEVAIPSALILCSDKITTENQIKKSSISQLLGKEKYEFEKKYNFSINNLLANFPESLFFVHPIKLSKWGK